MQALLIPDKRYEENGLKINEYFLTEHNPNRISLPSRRTLPLIGVTVHNTDDIKEQENTTDPEQYARATVNGAMGTVRVHFYVDDDEVWQTLPLDWQSWHAGQQGRADAHGSAAGNAQTISIECIMKGDGSEKDERAEDNCARLVAYLLKALGMNTKENLYTHNYWCNVRNGRKGTIDELNKLNDGYKKCPIFIRPHWDKFVEKVNGYMEPKAATISEKEKVEKQYLYNVVVGVYGVKTNAEAALKDVKKNYPDAFIKRTVKA